MINLPQTEETLNNYSNFLLNNTNNNSFNPFNFDDFHEKLLYDGKTSYASYLEKLDDLFANSDARKKSYHIKAKRTRSIETPHFKTITFKRRLYIHKVTGDTFYYIDESFLKLTRYQRISNQLKTKILSEVTELSYQKIANKYGISKTSVYTTIKSSALNFDQIYTNNNFEKIKVNILYIQADEVYVSLQKKESGKKNNKKIIEHVTIHLGIKNICNKRNALINKKLITRALNEDIEDFYKRVRDIIEENYEYNTLYCYGDGANWIKGLSSYIEATYILDLFHTYQAVNRITKANRDANKEMREYIKTNNLPKFKEYIKENFNTETMSDFQKKHYNYILNNWDFITNNYSLIDSVGCSQEGINFHHFASRLTTMPKGFSELNARFIAQLICLKVNQNNYLEILEKIVVKQAQENVKEMQRETRIRRNKKDNINIMQGKIPYAYNTTNDKKTNKIDKYQN